MIQLTYQCGCDWAFPENTPRVQPNGPIEKATTLCPYHRGEVSREWLTQDIRCRMVKINDNFVSVAPATARTDKL